MKIFNCRKALEDFRRKTNQNERKALVLREEAEKKIVAIREALKVRDLMFQRRLDDNTEVINRLLNLSNTSRNKTVFNIDDDVQTLENEFKKSEKEVACAEELMSKLLIMESYVNKLVL